MDFNNFKYNSNQSKFQFKLQLYLNYKIYFIIPNKVMNFNKKKIIMFFKLN